MTYWTQQENDDLLEAHSLGLTNEEIHEAILPNRTEKAIQQRLTKIYKLKSNRINKEK